jgi:RNA polymerase sporulation-specific sigma factor
MTNFISRLFKKLLDKLHLGFFEEDILCYISGNDVLPSPLTLEEEQYYVKELGLGNASAKCKLIEHNLRLVVYISKKFENT